MADIGWLAAASMRLADLRTPTLADEPADGDPSGVSGRKEDGQSADLYGGCRPFSIYPGQSTGGG